MSNATLLEITCRGSVMNILVIIKNGGICVLDDFLAPVTSTLLFLLSITLNVVMCHKYKILCHVPDDVV